MTFARSVDRAVDRVVAALGADWSQDLKETIGQMFSDAIGDFDRQRAEARALVDEKWSDKDAVSIDDLPLEDTATFFRAVADPPTVELQRAQVFVSGTWISVGVLRVELSHVSAWWPLDEQDGMEVTYSNGGQRPQGTTAVQPPADHQGRPTGEPGGVAPSN